MVGKLASRLHRARLPSLLIVCLSSSICGALSGESIDGRWEGIAELGERRIELALDLSSSPAGASARVTVPRERVLSRRLRDVAIEPPSISFSLPFGDREAPFRGTVRGDSLIGAVAVGADSMRLRFLRTGPSIQPPYREEEIRFTSGDLQLSGSLLLPPAPGPHPAIVLIHGSSSPDRDDFRFYADLFVRNGVAALIYDKRSTGSQTGGMSEVDLRDLARDAAAAASVLKRRTDVDPKRVGLWGHSQGGWVAPIAATMTDSVAFIVGFSAPGVTYAELDKHANATRLRAGGFDSTDVEEAMAALYRVDDFVRRGGDAAELQRFLDAARQHPWASQTTLPRRSPTVEETRTWLRWRNLDLDPVEYWGTTRAPVLLLYGERDDVVPVAVSAERIRDALFDGGNRQVTAKVFPGEGHTIGGSQEFLDLMVQWVVEHASVSDRP